MPALAATPYIYVAHDTLILGGQVVGGAAGSDFGPVGTFVGSQVGRAAGDYLHDQLADIGPPTAPPQWNPFDPSENFNEMPAPFSN